MADNNSPAETLLGVAGIGAGVLLLYGAFRNVSIFGRDGLLVRAITTGTFPKTADLPPMFGPLERLFTFPPNSKTATAQAQATIVSNIAIIMLRNPFLGKALKDAYAAWNPVTDTTGSAALRTYVADAIGSGGTVTESGKKIQAAIGVIGANAKIGQPGTPGTPSTMSPVDLA